MGNKHSNQEHDITIEDNSQTLKAETIEPTSGCCISLKQATARAKSSFTCCISEDGTNIVVNGKRNNIVITKN